MRIVRVSRGGGPARFGQLVDDEVQLFDQPPWDGGVPTGEALGLDQVRLLAPVDPSKIVAVGRNYVDHIREMGYETPVEPTVFFKPPTTIIGSGDDVILPPEEVSSEVEHEAELAVVIGRRVRTVAPDAAMTAVFGYTVADDVSARDLQRADATLARGKGWDTFCPIGPWIETELDPSSLPIRCRVNGQLRQDGTTANLLFDVPTIISFISQFLTLCPGDVLLTGSPGGSSALNDGDQVEIEIEGLGTLTHGVRSSDAADPR